MGFVGIALITLTQEFTVGKGDMLTFCLTITFSAQMIFRSTVVKDVDALLFTFVELDVYKRQGICSPESAGDRRL